MSIFCKLLYGLCFRNKHIIQYKSNLEYLMGMQVDIALAAAITL